MVSRKHLKVKIISLEMVWFDQLTVLIYSYLRHETQLTPNHPVDNGGTVTLNNPLCGENLMKSKIGIQSVASNSNFKLMEFWSNYRGFQERMF